MTDNEFTKRVLEIREKRRAKVLGFRILAFAFYIVGDIWIWRVYGFSLVAALTLVLIGIGLSRTANHIESGGNIDDELDKIEGKITKI